MRSLLCWQLDEAIFGAHAMLCTCRLWSYLVVANLGPSKTFRKITNAHLGEQVYSIDRKSLLYRMWWKRRVIITSTWFVIGAYAQNQCLDLSALVLLWNVCSHLNSGSLLQRQSQWVSWQWLIKFSMSTGPTSAFRASHPQNLYVVCGVDWVVLYLFSRNEHLVNDAACATLFQSRPAVREPFSLGEQIGVPLLTHSLVPPVKHFPPCGSSRLIVTHPLLKPRNVLQTCIFVCTSGDEEMTLISSSVALANVDFSGNTARFKCRMAWSFACM